MSKNSIPVHDQDVKDNVTEFTVNFTRNPYERSAVRILPDTLWDLYTFFDEGVGMADDFCINVNHLVWQYDRYPFDVIQSTLDEEEITKIETLAIIRGLVHYRRASGLHLLMNRIFDTPISYQAPETHTLDTRNLPRFLAMDVLNLSLDTMNGMSEPVIPEPEHDWERVTRSVPIEANVKTVYRALVSRASEWTISLLRPEFREKLFQSKLDKLGQSKLQ